MTPMHRTPARVIDLRPAERPEPVRGQPHQSAPDFRKMSDEGLATFIRDTEMAKIVITEELANDQAEGCPRGADWRYAAGRARSFRIAHLTLAKAEEARRIQVQKSAAGQNAPPKVKGPSQQEVQAMALRKAEAKVEAQRLALEEAKARKDAANAAKQVVWEERQASKAKMFLAAARTALTKDEVAAVWSVAQMMFPDAPEWEAFP